MIGKNQDMERIKFLEEAITPNEEKIENQKEANKEVEKEIKPHKKLDNNEAVKSRFGNAILSAGQGKITDIGGPSKQLGSETNNSIWDTNVLNKLKESKDNKEKTIESKEKINRLRNSFKQDRMDQMVESLHEVDNRKDATVKSIQERESCLGDCKLPKNNISIFDKEKDFSRVPEKTDGELVTEKIHAAAGEKDDSWKDVRGQTKRNNTLDNLFNNITNVEKK